MPTSINKLKRADMSRRMRRAQPKHAVRSIRVAIAAGPEQLSLMRAPADDYASPGEFTPAPASVPVIFLYFQVAARHRPPPLGDEPGGGLAHVGSGR
jgi:hypothetical protein